MPLVVPLPSSFSGLLFPLIGSGVFLVSAATGQAIAGDVVFEAGTGTSTVFETQTAEANAVAGDIGFVPGVASFEVGIAEAQIEAEEVTFVPGPATFEVATAEANAVAGDIGFVPGAVDFEPVTAESQSVAGDVSFLAGLFLSTETAEATIEAGSVAFAPGMAAFNAGTAEAHIVAGPVSFTAGILFSASTAEAQIESGEVTFVPDIASFEVGTAEAQIESGEVSFVPGPATFEFATAEATIEAGEVEFSVPSGPFLGDEFTSTTLSSFWTPVGFDDVNATFALPGGTLNFTLIVGVGYDQYFAATSAPKLIQDCANEDFVCTVRYNNNLSYPGGPYRYHSRGIYVQGTGTDNWITFDFYRGGESTTLLSVFASTTVSAFTTIRTNTSLGEVATAPYYVRITRSGNNWTYESSDDGSSWTYRSSFDFTMAVSKIGLFFPSSVNGTPHTTEVDWFREG